MRLRPVSLVSVVTALAGAVPCGTTVAAAGQRAATRAVAYGGVTVRVPANWPVHDLAREPRTCVRFDRHAVYLGQAGTEQDCPAHAVGRVEAVVLEPAPVTASSPAERGRIVEASPDPGVSRTLADVRVTASYAGDEDGLARTIVGSASVTDPGARVPTPRNAAPDDRDLSGVSDPSDLSGVGDQGQPVDAAIRTLPGRNTFTGSGFDTCGAPSIATMKTWRSASPYQSAGIYIGGADRACPDGNLSPSWVSLAAGQGWQLFPIYVGLQAPCWVDPSKGGRIDPARRSDQGTEAANDAAGRAAHFGLAAGSAIYFDMEGYPRGDKVCSDAVKAFLGNWTRGLHAHGYLAGVYSSASAAVADLVDIYNDTPAARPDAVWFAHWDKQPTLFGDGSLPDQMWRGHQRAKQYLGGHNETYGGKTLNLDADVLDAPVAVVGNPLQAQPARGPGLLFDTGKGTTTLYSWTSDGSTFPGPSRSGPYDVDAARVGDRVAVCGFTTAAASDLVTLETAGDANASADGAVLRLHAGTGSGTFATSGTTWWSGTLPGLATARIAAGDFDGSGHCGVAALVDGSGGGGIAGSAGAGARIYQWTSNGSSFTGPTMWQAAAAWPASRFAQRIAAAPFTSAGHADLAVATQNPDGTMDIRVLPHAVGGADGTPGASWFHSGPFDLGSVGARIVAGRFTPNDTSGRADLAMLYDQGSGRSTLFRWHGAGASFGWPGTWNGVYDASRVGPRLIAADITGTGTSAVVAASQRPDGTFAFHVWDRASDYAGPDGWFVSGAFPLTSVGGRLVMI